MTLVDLFEAETDKIWAQAGIDVEFLPLNYYSNSAFIVLSEDEIQSFFDTAGGASADPYVINVWYTGSINSASLGMVTGITNDIGGNKIILSAYSSKYDIVDILSHEIGHSLGLEHINNPWDYGNMMQDYLMSSFLMCTSSINDIYLGGIGLSFAGWLSRRKTA